MRETVVTYRGVDWEVGYDWYAAYYGDSRDISIAYIKYDSVNVLDYLDDDVVYDIRDTIYAQLRRVY